MFHWHSYYRKVRFTSHSPPPLIFPSFKSRTTQQQLNSLTLTELVQFTGLGLAFRGDCISFLFCDYKPFVFPGVDKIFFLFFSPSLHISSISSSLSTGRGGKKSLGVLVNMQPNPEGICLLKCCILLLGSKALSARLGSSLGLPLRRPLRFFLWGALFPGLCLPPPPSSPRWFWSHGS